MKFFNKFTQKIRNMDMLTKVVMIVFIVLAITTSILTYGFIKNLTTGMTILDLPGVPILDSIFGQDSDGMSQLASSSGVATPEPWDGKSRVTILMEKPCDYPNTRFGL